MFWREGVYFLIGQKHCFKGSYEKSFLNCFWFHTLAQLSESTPGFFNQGWVDEENKAGLILIRHRETFNRQRSLGKYEGRLTWLGIRWSFVYQRHLWDRRDILHSLAYVWHRTDCIDVVLQKISSVMLLGRNDDRYAYIWEHTSSPIKHTSVLCLQIVFFQNTVQIRGAAH